MKKQMILGILLIELFSATVIVDKDISNLDIIKEQIINNFAVQPEPSVEIVDEYTLAMGGYLA